MIALREKRKALAVETNEAIMADMPITMAVVTFSSIDCSRFAYGLHP